jgi:4'-phosphopantetheinyl transferase
MSNSWLAAPAAWALLDDEVHVWRARLDGAERGTTMGALLSADERERAAGFYRKLDAEQFVVARGILRRILAGYLDTVPASLCFEKNEHGKPSLAGEHAGSLSFNISHSGTVGLFAVSRQRVLGIDIERHDTELDYARLSRRLFSPAEAAALASIDDAKERVKAFFRCWTRKEAYIKAQGKGMVLGLRSFDVTLAPGEGARLVTTRPDAAEAGRWQLRDLQPAPGYAAALAVKGWDWTLRCWTWAEQAMG